MAQVNESSNEPADESVEQSIEQVATKTDAIETATSLTQSTPTANADALHEFGKPRVLYLNHAGQMSGAEQSLRALLWQFRRDRNEIDPVIALPGGGPFSELLRDEGWNVTFAPLRRLHRPQGFLDGM